MQYKTCPFESTVYSSNFIFFSHHFSQFPFEKMDGDHAKAILYIGPFTVISYPITVISHSIIVISYLSL